jgi:hypothetical protein
MLLAPPALASPTFSVARGFYSTEQSVELAPEDPAATVLYSTDGSTPSVVYTGPLDVATTLAISAMEVAPDGSTSVVVTHSYLFPDSVVLDPEMESAILSDPEYAAIVADVLWTLPAVSIVLPGSLSQAEQAISLEWIDPDGDDSQANAGARLVGGASISYEKNSIRLVFRGSYGANHWEFDVYGDDATGVRPADEFDALTLRGGNHDTPFYLGSAGQYLRNFWMDESQLEMGHVAPHGRFASLYVNGRYRGLYHVRERFNAAMMAEYLGGDEDDYEAVNGGDAFDGDGSAWAQVVANASSYQTVGDWLNVENFLDYMVLNFYAGNAWDWAYYHNWIAAGPVDPGQGGFRFHSSDSDICLYYDWTVNILSNPGPSYVFYYLTQERDPDFQVALQDAIARNLDGPLAADAARARYERLAALAEDPVVPESARWGGGWWDRDEEWVTERDRLLDGWFPYRTDEMDRQFREAGWLVLGAPTFDTAEGTVEAGSLVTIAAPDGADGILLVTRDGTDPRLAGGDISPVAEGFGAIAEVTVDHGVQLKARVLDGETWGALGEATFAVDEASPLILNEWNAVDEDETIAGGDDALGAVAGNGGDWLELLVTRDGTDLRGWTLQMRDRRGERGTLTFTDHDALAELQAGTLLTIAEDLPEDATVEPGAGDWRLHLRAGEFGSGEFVSPAPFDVTAHDWQLTVRDAEGWIRFGPVGEGVSPRGGVSGREVGLLAADPSSGTRPGSDAYMDGVISTFGAANRWDGGAQDLSALRGEASVVEEADTATVATSNAAISSEGCACGGGVGAGWLAPLAALALCRRRAPLAVAIAGCSATPRAGGQAPTPSACWADLDADGWGDEAVPAACGSGTAPRSGDCDDGDEAVSPDSPEQCNGRDDDCDGATDEDPVDPLPFYADEDGDGWGSADELILACEAGDGAALLAGDCDEADPSVNPDAVEACDDVDQDCDGFAGDGAGASEECAGSTCLELLEAGNTEDGAYWLTLPSGAAAGVWCDMTTDGGGWTLGFLRNTAHTGSQGDFGSGEVDLPSLGASPAQASASSTPAMGWLDLNTFDWTELRLSAASSGADTYTSRNIARSELRISFGDDGYLLYGGESGYYWCGGDASYTDGGAGAVNNPDAATTDCKGHGSLGSGWDFSEVDSANAGLTLCGGDGSYFLAASWGGTWTYYGAAGGAEAIWVR